MYQAKEERYDQMIYTRCGKSGLKLPKVSLGFWQNFGAQGQFSNMEQIVHTAFDLGITHFDLANNYGHPYNGSAEENFGKILANGMKQYRDEMCISTKAGYEMWAGPYGDRNGSRKYLIASLDQSLQRMGLEYVDIFYHHVYDPDTPLEETAMALDQIVRQGKALYVGISNYNKEQTAEMQKLLAEQKTPFIINQPSYSILNRWIEEDGLDQYAKENGYDAFSTTLLVSPYQKHELIIQMAEEAGKEFDIPFYYEDFRKGYQRGVDISLELELYRQPYCGCVFSERDRYEKKPKVKLD